MAYPIQAREYSLENATADVTVAPNGIVHVKESTTYSFSGTFREVFRQVYPPPGGTIENIEIGCLELPCQGRVDRIKDGYELVGVLPQPTPAEITLMVSYDYYGGLKVYDDVSELHYKLWGDEWEKPLGRMEAVIHLPEGAGPRTRYWLHPAAFTEVAQIEGDVIRLETRTIPPHSWYEIRATFPVLAAPDLRYVSRQPGPGLEAILEVEGAHERKAVIAEKLYVLVWLVALVVAAVPLYIFWRFGREPEVDYRAIYEREPPSSSKPAVVNAIMRGKIGEPDMDGFIATLMDLVYRGYMDLRDEKGDVILEMKERDTRELEDFELRVITLLNDHLKDGRISWKRLKDELGEDSTFYDFMNDWYKEVERHIKVNSLFVSEGNRYLGIFGWGVIIISVLAGVGILALFPPGAFPAIWRIATPGIGVYILATAAVSISMVNEQWAGRFTPEGRLYYERWKNFRRYLTDFSALKEHPPGSIVLWDFYMVYAVALGVAEEALKNMSLLVPEERRSSRFHGLPPGSGFFGGFSSAYRSSNPTGRGGGSGGVGGVGGGFGGGGGGAR